MSETTKAPRIANLELNRETIQELTEQEGEQAKGGMRGETGTQCVTTPDRVCCWDPPYTDAAKRPAG